MSSWGRLAVGVEKAAVASAESTIHMPRSCSRPRAPTSGRAERLEALSAWTAALAWARAWRVTHWCNVREAEVLASLDADAPPAPPLAAPAAASAPPPDATTGATAGRRSSIRLTSGFSWSRAPSTPHASQIWEAPLLSTAAASAPPQVSSVLNARQAKERSDDGGLSKPAAAGGAAAGAAAGGGAADGAAASGLERVEAAASWAVGWPLSTAWKR